VIVPTSADDMQRLIAVVDHQRRELDRIRAAAAGESVVAMARGALMERLGLSAAEAASQLAELSAATGVPAAEMAAAVLSGALSDSERAGAAGLASRVGRGDWGDLGGVQAAVAGGPSPGPAAEVRRDGTPGPRSLMVEAAAEMAADGAELVAMLAGQVLIPFGAAVVALWLLEVDGTLALLGEAGLSIGEANRWQRIPPQFDCPAQRVARGAGDLWWVAGRPGGAHPPGIRKTPRRGQGGPGPAPAER